MHGAELEATELYGVPHESINVALADCCVDPVFYCNDLGKEPGDDLQGTASSTRSRTSLKEAVRFASSNNLMGIICSSRLMVGGAASFFLFVMDYHS